MNRRRFLLGSAAILAAPSIVPQAVADGLLPVPARPCPGMVTYGRSPVAAVLADIEALSQAMADLAVWGRSVVRVDPDGVRALDPVALLGAS